MIYSKLIETNFVFSKKELTLDQISLNGENRGEKDKEHLKPFLLFIDNNF